MQVDSVNNFFNKQYSIEGRTLLQIDGKIWHMNLLSTINKNFKPLFSVKYNKQTW